MVCHGPGLVSIPGTCDQEVDDSPGSAGARPPRTERRERGSVAAQPPSASFFMFSSAPVKAFVRVSRSLVFAAASASGA